MDRLLVPENYARLRPNPTAAAGDDAIRSCGESRAIIPRLHFLAEISVNETKRVHAIAVIDGRKQDTACGRSQSLVVIVRVFPFNIRLEKRVRRSGCVKEGEICADFNIAAGSTH